MTVETFEWIWDTVEPNIAAIEDILDAKEKDRLHFHRVYTKEETKSVIYQEYDAIRKDLKAEYYKLHDPETVDSDLLDHHKIAACMCQALLKKKVFAFDMDDTISAEMLLSNYKLAYISSLAIVYLFMLDWYITQGNKTIVDQLLNQQQLLAPKTTKTHASYHVGRIKTLAQNEHRGVAFDVLTYAAKLYWLEHYNRQLLENKIDVDPYDPETLATSAHCMND